MESRSLTQLKTKLQLLQEENDELKIKLRSSLGAKKSSQEITSYAKLIHEIPIATFLTDHEGALVTMNEPFCLLLGFELTDEFDKSDIEFFLKTKAKKLWRKDKEVITKGTSLPLKREFTNFQGKRRAVVIEKNRVFDEFQNAYVLTTLTNRSESKQMEIQLEKKEQRISSYYKQVSALQKEVHSGVKSSLQLVNSLASAQVRYTTDSNSKEMLSTLKFRVLAMAAIHEYLDSNERLGFVEIGMFCRKLSEQVISIQLGKASRVHINVSGVKIYLKSKLLFSFGLIINELITNCLKNISSIQEGKGNIWISIEIAGNNDLLLTYKEIGLGSSAANMKQNSLEMDLIEAQLEELNGKISIKQEGNIALLRFKDVDFRLRLAKPKEEQDE